MIKTPMRSRDQIWAGIMEARNKKARVGGSLVEIRVACAGTPPDLIAKKIGERLLEISRTRPENFGQYVLVLRPGEQAEWRPPACSEARCTKCNLVNEYAEPSTSYVCYNCR